MRHIIQNYRNHHDNSELKVWQGVMVVPSKAQHSIQRFTGYKYQHLGRP